MRSTMMAAFGLALTVAFAGGAQAQDKAADKGTKQSQSFIKAAIEGNNAEIEVGKLAVEKGKNDAVKRFGRMLVEDHGTANDNAKAAASKLGVEPPTGTTLMQKGTYAKLKVLSGDMFDKSFAKSMVADHEKDVKEYQKAAAMNDAAGAYAKDTLPHLQAHLRTAQELNTQLQKPAKTSSTNSPSRATTGGR